MFVLGTSFGPVQTFFRKIKDFQFLESLDITGWTG